VSVFYRHTEQQGIFLGRNPASSEISHESCDAEDSDLRNTSYKDLMKSCIQLMAVLKPNETVCLLPLEHYNCGFEVSQCMDF